MAGSKVIVFGSINGRFKDTFDKLKKINAKAGPFVAAICVGKFFVQGCEAEWQQVKAGGCVIPLYMFGPHTHDVDISQFDSKSDGELAPNVFYLGKRGILKTSGMTIAYLSGVDGETHQDGMETTFSPEDVQSIRDQCYRNAEFKGVDFLLTYEWPADVSKNETEAGMPKGTVPPGSEKVSWLALHIRPQYIFSGRENLSYHRRPYVNYIDGRIQHLTKFVAVPANPTEKWIFPFNFHSVPNRSEALNTRDDCPFNRNMLNYVEVPSSKPEGKQYFFSTSQDNVGKKRKMPHHHHDDRRKKFTANKFDVNNCWFCLANVKEKDLVLMVCDEVYLFLAKGYLTEDHMMIVPIEHYIGSHDIPSQVLDEIERTKDALRAYFKDIGKVPIFFERCYKTFHAQIHVIPVPENMQGVEDKFKTEAEKLELEFLDIAPNVQIKDVVNMKEEAQDKSNQSPKYFYLELSKKKRMLFFIQSRDFPLDFGREVLASREVLNLPDRVSWKDVIDEEEERLAATRHKEHLKPFF